MSSTDMMRARLKKNRPSRRHRARPPKQRTALGQAFSAANLGSAIALQQCRNCDARQYPPRDVCHQCLGDDLVWRDCSSKGKLLSAIPLHHSLWEYFKRRLDTAPWPIASVRLEEGPIVFAHLHPQSLLDDAGKCPPADTPVKVFSHTDSSLNSVMIAVSASTDIASATARTGIAEAMGLTEPALRPGGI